ncbi:MAG: hypothetical protein QMD53_00100 [Actinomycetota bacterium]|nr:hypothetical protein [Actinomycetota bacterium]
MISKLEVADNVEILNSTKSKRIFGERFVTGLSVEDETGKIRDLDLGGMFAAGDVTDVPEKQIIVAAGQGCIASLNTFKYLARKKF